MKLIQQFVDYRDRKFVLNRVVVEGLLIHAEAPTAICLSIQKDQRREGALAWSYNSGEKEFTNDFFQF
jgi:hypothetical protein